MKKTEKTCELSILGVLGSVVRDLYFFCVIADGSKNDTPALVCLGVVFCCLLILAYAMADHFFGSIP